MARFLRIRSDRATRGEILRFGLVGVSSVGVYLVIIITLMKLTPFPLPTAAVVAYMFAMVWNYLLQRNWTFRSKNKHSFVVPRFIIVHAVGIVINAASLHVLATGAGLSYVVAQVVAIVFVATWSYLVQKIWVFMAATHER